MKLKPQSCSSTGLERHFERLAHHREAWSRLGSKAFGPSRRFSAWLARTSWCANLQQNHRHHPTHLLGGQRTISRLPWSMQGLSQLACQIQLVKNQDQQPTPALKLGRRAHMHPRPEQLLLEKTVVVLLGETATILTNQLTRGSRFVPLAFSRETGITERSKARSCWKCKWFQRLICTRRPSAGSSLHTSSATPCVWGRLP